MKTSYSCGMNRAEAYKALRRIENSDDDARANFKLVKNAVESGKTTWAEAVDSFGRILSVEGGSGSTSDAQESFSKAARSVRHACGRSLAVTSQIYCQIRRSENDRDDSVDDFELVRATSDELGVPFAQVAECFLRVLAAEGGRGSTQEAQRAFRDITAAARRLPEGLDVLTATYRDLRVRENESDQARENFHLVVQACERFSYPIQRMGHLFNEVLQVEGGRGETAEAQRAFRLLMTTGGQVDEGIEDIQRAYLILRRAENNSDDACENFELISRAARASGCSMVALAEEFNDLLRTEGGSSNTSEAQAAFRTIYLD